MKRINAAPPASTGDPEQRSLPLVSALREAPTPIRERIRAAHVRPLVGLRTASDEVICIGRRAPAQAWSYPILEWLRAGHAQAAIGLDLDDPVDVGLALDALRDTDSKLPRPSVVAVRERSGHALAVWGLASPVAHGPKARQGPRRFLGRVAEYLAWATHADAGFVGVLAALAAELGITPRAAASTILSRYCSREACVAALTDQPIGGRRTRGVGGLTLSHPSAPAGGLARLDAGDRTISAETEEAIRRHVELPPPDQPVILDDIRDLYAEMQESGRGESVPPELLAEMVRVVSTCVERAQTHRLRRLAEVVYGTANLADVTPERFEAAVKAEVARREGYTSIEPGAGTAEPEAAR